MAKKERIGEIDALRGLFIIFVVIIHLIFDLEYIYKIDLKLPNIYYFIQINGGVLFILISGISITLGSRCIKRPVCSGLRTVNNTSNVFLVP